MYVYFRRDIQCTSTGTMEQGCLVGFACFDSIGGSECVCVYVEEKLFLNCRKNWEDKRNSSKE